MFWQKKCHTTLIPLKRKRKNPLQWNKRFEALISLKQKGGVTIGGVVLKWEGMWNSSWLLCSVVKPGVEKLLVSNIRDI